MRSKMILSLALGLAAALSLAQGPESLVGKKAPTLNVKTMLNGAKAPLKATNLTKLKGKVVVLDFWAFW